ncbi:MAG: hypothetical protein NTX13_03325 [Acidobacteria bacterium]|nr:hypothetical protein [Acidobacteriota bacterium]
MSELISAKVDKRVKDLERRLIEFYQTDAQYPAYLTPPSKNCWHQVILSSILRKIDDTKDRKIRVLEVGAGSTTFLSCLGEIEDRVEFVAHDITDRNRSYLSSHSHRSVFGPLEELEEVGKFDIIFSLFVMEHLVRPLEHCRLISKMLIKGGSHIVVCPRYDLPGYVCPSLRRVGVFGVGFAEMRAKALLLGLICSLRAGYLVNANPAVLRGAWFRDADAVHLVSGVLLDRWHRRNRFSILRPKLEYFGDGNALFRRLCVLVREYVLR